MQTQDLERIRFVTRHYGELQGLAGLVPAGGVLLAFGLGERAGGPLLAGLALVLGASSPGLAIVAKLYYRRTFGEVERQPGHLRTLLWVLIFFGLELIPSLGAARHAYILVSLLLLSWWVSLQGRWSQVYYLVLGGLLLGLGALPSAFFLPALQRGGLPDILAGTALILAGLLDHRLLVRVLRPLPAAIHEGSEDGEPLEVKR